MHVIVELAHVKRSHYLVLLLTPGILSRPWCLVEIATAQRNKVHILPVEVQRPGMKFQYPDDAFYENFRTGGNLTNADQDLLLKHAITISELEASIRQVFKKIAQPFSPHKSRQIRKAELVDTL